MITVSTLVFKHFNQQDEVWSILNTERLCDLYIDIFNDKFMVNKVFSFFFFRELR